ncbi:MAG: hypothetical protein P8X63_11925, partial [Desulfuromonadaceae bacterium]
MAFSTPSRRAKAGLAPRKGVRPAPENSLPGQNSLLASRETWNTNHIEMILFQNTSSVVMNSNLPHLKLLT